MEWVAPMRDLTLNRRRFLLVAGATTAAATAVGVQYLVSSNGSPPGLDRRLRAFVAAGGFSPELGKEYLISRNLAIEDVNDFLAAARNRLAAEDDIHASIQRQIAADFAGGDICRLHGWHLSITECRLAAAAYVIARNGGRMEEAPEGAEGPLDHLPPLDIAQVERWGPRSGRVGEAFNVQRNGGSALWFAFLELDRYPDYRIHVGSEAAVTTVNAGKRLITARVTSDQSRRITSKEGLIPVHLVDPVRGKQLIGYFEVKP